MTEFGARSPDFVNYLAGQASAFVHNAERNWDDSQLALIAYRETKYDYLRQVDVHSHWIGLTMLMLSGPQQPRHGGNCREVQRAYSGQRKAIPQLSG